MTSMTAEGFAGGSGSYWNSVLPRLDHFIRISNARPVVFDEVFPIEPVSRRQSFVSETGFYLWAIHMRGELEVDDFEAAQEMARRRLRTLAPHMSLVEDLSAPERAVAMIIAQRIDTYCSDFRSLKDIAIEPSLAGCGWISGGLPDLTALQPSEDESTTATLLAEVKCVDRTFRSVDMRQLVCYAVLHYADTGSIPDRFAVINPMRATALEVDVVEFFEDVVGAEAYEVVNELAVEWASAGVSP